MIIRQKIELKLRGAVDDYRLKTQVAYLLERIATLGIIGLYLSVVAAQSESYAFVKIIACRQPSCQIEIIKPVIGIEIAKIGDCSHPGSQLPALHLCRYPTGRQHEHRNPGNQYTNCQSLHISITSGHKGSTNFWRIPRTACPQSVYNDCPCLAGMSTRYFIVPML